MFYTLQFTQIYLNKTCQLELTCYVFKSDVFHILVKLVKSS